jgi:hypothetical protein
MDIQFIRLQAQRAGRASESVRNQNHQAQREEGAPPPSQAAEIRGEGSTPTSVTLATDRSKFFLMGGNDVVDWIDWVGAVDGAPWRILPKVKGGGRWWADHALLAAGAKKNGSGRSPAAVTWNAYATQYEPDDRNKAGIVLTMMTTSRQKLHSRTYRTSRPTRCW